MDQDGFLYPILDGLNHAYFSKYVYLYDDSVYLWYKGYMLEGTFSVTKKHLFKFAHILPGSSY